MNDRNPPAPCAMPCMQLANAPRRIGGFFPSGGVGTWQQRPSSAVNAESGDKEHMRIQMTCNGRVMAEMGVSGADCRIAVGPASQQMGCLFSSRFPRLEARR